MYNTDKKVTFKTSKEFTEVEKAIPTNNNVNKRSETIELGNLINLEVISQLDLIGDTQYSFTTSKSK